MKTHNLGKRENSREVKEAKKSEGKSRKVPTDEAPRAKTPNDIDLAVAEMIYNRQPYDVIAKEWRVAPKTISKIKKMLDDGIIRITENGKAINNKNTDSIEIGPLPKPLQMDILGAAHLEGKSPQDLITGLIRLDQKMRLKELNLNQLKRVAEFLEKAYSHDWTNDALIDILTLLQNSGLLGLNQEHIDLLREFLEKTKSLGLKPEHIIKVSQRTEDDWRKIIQEAQKIGYKDGVKHHSAWLIDFAGKVFDDLGLLQTLCKLSVLAEKSAVNDIGS